MNRKHRNHAQLDSLRLGGVSIGDATYLTHLAGREVSMREIGRRMKVSHVAVSKAQRRLEAAGVLRGTTVTDKGLKVQRAMGIIQAAISAVQILMKDEPITQTETNAGRDTSLDSRV